MQYFVVGEDLEIFKQGTLEDCRQFLDDPVTSAIFEAGSISARIMTVEQYNNEFAVLD